MHAHALVGQRCNAHSTSLQPQACAGRVAGQRYEMHSTLSPPNTTWVWHPAPTGFAPLEADTWLEVGSWSWNWMEPPLGTISFFLLCVQFAREQRMSIGGKAMTERMQDYQAEKLTAAFPQSDETIVRQFAASIALVDSTEDVKLEHTFIEAFLKQGK